MIFKILLMKIEENKQMRRAKRQVTDIDLIKKFVDEVEVVRIAINGDKYPYVGTTKPLACISTEQVKGKKFR